MIDVASGNLVGSYASEEETRAIARRAYEAHGEDGVLGHLLIRVQGDDQERFAENADLVAETLPTTEASSVSS